ncbi:methionine aminopeptidase, type I [Allomyces macrogynus ATCC 38327]|uniref:Methionine aminopeptidase n=1 Tax=Allomyces macrogynus (strain ATCC 38327) TaxID=578462 RepID=A0A0L0SJH8_ALLM3|nr:methionine aminopeptidase, type I [Allomyces macrogynus ATCC 38327]|eukprot:KNE62651.1 methionine aminopeptidase, type I [Allomyces macrogynus ATCC 38327]
MTAATATATASHPCQGADCTKTATLVCPTCIKLDLPRDTARFCSQTCFKANWATHKLLHQQAQTYDPFTQVPGFRYTGSLRARYPLSATRFVPPHIKRPDYAETGRPYSEEKLRGSNRIETMNEAEIQKMREVCRIAREVLDAGAAAVRPGVTTDHIDKVVHEATVARDAYPSPLNYMGFPKSCCTSVNEVICHGIPDMRPLEDGDIVNIDVSVFKDGFHADLNETYFVGAKAWHESKALIDCTRECLKRAIEMVKPGVMYRELGNVIEKTAKERGFAVVRTYCGHGIHRLFHTTPNIPHYAKNKAIGVMKPGHIFTIEPMINVGTHADDHWPDNWTAVTRDGKRSAQFEHTMVVTETGCEILTLRRGHDIVMDGLIPPPGVEEGTVNGTKTE